MGQGDLFDIHPAEISHVRDPWTSHEAGMKALRNAKGLNRQILDELSKVFPKGLTDEELAERLAVDSTVTGNSVAKRRSNLKSLGLVEASKETKTNSQGNKVTSWKLYYPPSQITTKWTP